MTLEEMKERRIELGISYERLSEMTNVPIGTVQKVLGGITKSPRYDTLTALEKVLGENKTDVVREAMGCMAQVESKKPGEYRLEDYYALPDDRRAELIDGYFYDMAAPTGLHQILVTEVCMKFRNYIGSKGGKCISLVSPVDVQLDCDDKTMLQPDFMVICDRDKIDKHVYGNPDLVVEILSPSTAKIDNKIKSIKYANAGVKEYWIVDPVKKKILVQNFEEDEWPVIYSFTDKIPVHIFPEECEIDFGEINDYVKFMYEKNNR